MRNARITEFLGDDHYDFRLGFGQLLELQEKTEVGPFALYRRFMNEEWLIGDIYETIRIGLVGGGMPHKDAFKLATKYVKECPPLENLNLARLVLIAGLHGAPEEDAGSPKKADDGDSDGKPMKSREFYGMGAVMGYTPQEVDAMTLHQIKAAFDGFASHHSGNTGAMSEEEKDDLFAMVLEEQDRIDARG